MQLRKSLKNSAQLSDGAKDVMLSGVCAFELGCCALEQGVLLDQYGLQVWVTGTDNTLQFDVEDYVLIVAEYLHTVETSNFKPCLLHDICLFG